MCWYAPARDHATTDLRAEAAWLDNITNYELVLAYSVRTHGFLFEIEVEHKALRPEYSATTLKIIGLEKCFICDGDSLWSSMSNFKTYSVEPWSGLTVSRDDTSTSLIEALKQPPYPFDFIQRILMPEGDYEYELEGPDTIDISGLSRLCEIWHLVNDPDDGISARIWIDTERRIVLKAESSVVDATVGAMNFILRVPTLKIDESLQPSDFVFIPEPGFTRVSAPSRLVMSASLEGETPPDVELHDLDGGIVTTSDWRGRVVVLDFWATWCGPCLKGMPHLRELRRDYGDDVLIVGVTSEPLATVQRFPHSV